jgi:transposase
MRHSFISSLLAAVGLHTLPCYNESSVAVCKALNQNFQLIVNFKEVVHSVRAGNADVGRRQQFAGAPNGHAKNARLTPKGREDLVRAAVDGGLSNAAAARRFNTTHKTVAKWIARFKAEGVSMVSATAPQNPIHRQANACCHAGAVERLRRERHTQEHIAAEFGTSKPASRASSNECGFSLPSSLEPQHPRPRYEREKRGEIIHLDSKKLGRLHVSVDSGDPEGGGTTPHKI